MSVFRYYILGFVAGGVIVALIFGIWWALPESVQADRSDQVETVSQDVLSIDHSISISRRNAITRAVENASPAVVGINVIAVKEYVTQNPFFNDPYFRHLFPPRVWREKVENLGSGFLISPDGYILTNQHVVMAATQIVVTMTDGEKYDSDIVGYDYDADIAVLKIGVKNLPYIRFGDSNDVIIGEWAIAIGNPFGLFAIHAQPTVTVGVISATNRDFDRNENGRIYSDMIQTDASINRGNSGGPLINSAGELIGMNTMIFTESGGSIGLGFAIPSNKLLETFNELKSRGQFDRDYWIGLEIQNVNRVIAISLRLPEIRGVVVTEVEKDSPAAKAGIEVTDVIWSINGSRTDDVHSAQKLLRNTDLRVGDKLKLDIVREGKIEEVVLVLGKKD